MEHETQLLLFNTRVLKVDPVKLDVAGYHCLRNFFETINLVERKLRKISASYHSLVREGEREGGSEGGREGGKEGGREGRKKEGGKEGGRKEERREKG